MVNNNHMRNVCDFSIKVSSFSTLVLRDTLREALAFSDLFMISRAFSQMPRGIQGCFSLSVAPTDVLTCCLLKQQRVPITLQMSMSVPK